MESPRKTRVLTGRLLLLLLLTMTAWGAYTQWQSEAARALAAKEDSTLYLALLTQPAMTAAFNPASRKAVMTTVNRKKTPKDPTENAQNLFKATAVSPKQIRYYIPKTLKRDAYWDEFKLTLSSWRFKPFLAARAVWDYIYALHDKRTNLTPAEFLLYGMELSRMEMTDFTVRTAGEKTPKKKSSSQAPKDYIPAPVQDRAPLAVENRPLVVEILNASGKKGAALELTQYLREKTHKGLLNVDVLQYDNFPGGRQPETHIIDYAGRMEQIKQLSTAIGVNSEVSSEKQGNAICDARIIIGEDFKQPI